MTFRLDRAGVVRPAAEADVDSFYQARIAALLGPFAGLHLIKRAQAAAGGGPLVDGDAAAILARAGEQDEALAGLDRARRGWKARLRAAGTAAEIRAILAEMKAQG